MYRYLIIIIDNSSAIIYLDILRYIEHLEHYVVIAEKSCNDYTCTYILINKMYMYDLRNVKTLAMEDFGFSG